MIGLLIRGLALIAHLEDLGIRHGLIETGHDDFIAKDGSRTLGVRLPDGVANPLRGRPLLLAFDFANRLDKPLLPYGLAGRPRIGVASLPHRLQTQGEWITSNYKTTTEQRAHDVTDWYETFSLQTNADGKCVGKNTRFLKVTRINHVEK